MGRNLTTLLQTLSCQEAPETLAFSIEKCITARKMIRSAVRRCVAFACASVLSLAVLVPIVKSSMTLFTQSGAGEFIGLLFSDTATVALYWREIISSIFESLPMVSITAVLGVSFVLFISFGFIIKDLLYIRTARILNV